MLVCMATEHNCFINPYCSLVYYVAISLRHQAVARNSAVIGANLRMRIRDNGTEQY